jgi:hypothetical protein
MMSESVLLRCIANCLETSQYYVGKGNRASADWWHDRADMYTDRLAAYRKRLTMVSSSSAQPALSVHP